MRDWSMSLEAAFEASLQKDGRIGNIGNRLKKANHLKVRATTRVAHRDYQAQASGNRGDRSTGNREALAKQQVGSPVTQVTDVTTDNGADYEERAALVEYGAGVPRDWAEGFARLDLASPSSGFSIARWRMVINDGGRFLDRWAGEAADLGWQATDVFGVYPAAPFTRFEAMGLVPIIGGGEVISITERTATIRSQGGQLLIYMRRPCQGAVCLWEPQTPDTDPNSMTTSMKKPM